MAEIRGSDTDAVAVEANLLLETSTPAVVTETQDTLQEEQLSNDNSEMAKPSNNEAGDKIASEGEIVEFSTSISQHIETNTMQINEVEGDGTAVVEETMQQDKESNNPVSEEESLQVKVEDVHTIEASNIISETKKEIDYVETEVGIGGDAKSEESDNIKTSHPSTAIPEESEIIQQVDKSKNSDSKVESSSQQIIEEINKSEFLITEKEMVKKTESEISAKIRVQEDANFEDGDKISVPDPSIIETSTLLETSPSSDTEQNDSMMDGAWADILGSGQLKKKTLQHGKPNSRPVSSAICTVNISGQLSNGDTVDVHENFKFQLGDLEVIQGIDLIVALMDVGEISRIEIGPRFAYGSTGNGKDIPKESTILYTVELIAVEKEKDLEDHTLQERLKIGNLKRERGNYWYSRCDYPSSIQCYRRALEYLDTENETETDSPDKLQEILDDRLKVYNNMGAAQMKIEAYDAALKSVEHVLRCQKDNVKAIYRKAKILTELGKVREAIGLLERALHIDPSSKIIQQDLMRLQAKQKSDVAKERSLYKKMFQLNDPPSSASSNEKPKIKLTVPWTLMIGAVTACVASYVTYRYKLF